VIRSAPKYLNGDYRLFELTVVAFQVLFGEKPQEPAHPLIPDKTRAGQDPFQLPARGVNICGRHAHVPTIPIVSIMCKCMKHAFNLYGLALFPSQVHRGFQTGSKRKIHKEDS
jgi:hypothetical protein